MTPEGWKRAHFGEIVDGEVGLQTGPFGSQLHASDYTLAGVPVIMPKDLKDGTIVEDTISRIPKQLVSKLNKYSVNVGDILLGRRGEIGRCGLVTEKERGWLCGTGCLRARIVPKMADPCFIIYALIWAPSVKWLTDNAVGQTMLNLNTIILSKLPILLPPLKEQRKIAAILSSIDDAIQTTQAVIDQLGVVKKALLADLLTRGIPGRHAKFKQTEIGEVPEEWVVTPLNNVAFVQTGIAKGKPFVNGIEVPYLRVANVQDGYVDLSEVKTISVDQQAVARYALQPGDVLFTEGGDADKLGRGCVWRGEIGLCLFRLRQDSLHQNHVFAVRTETSQLLPDYLAHWAASPRGKSYFFDCAKQTTNLASINSTQLRAFPVAIPPISEQAEIVAAIGAVDTRFSVERERYETAISLKTALMSALLTGELRIPSEKDPT